MSDYGPAFVAIVGVTLVCVTCASVWSLFRESDARRGLVLGVFACAALFLWITNELPLWLWLIVAGSLTLASDRASRQNR